MGKECITKRRPKVPPRWAKELQAKVAIISGRVVCKSPKSTDLSVGHETKDKGGNGTSSRDVSQLWRVKEVKPPDAYKREGDRRSISFREDK